MPDAPHPRPKCSVKNCQKELEQDDQVMIRGQMLCKSCAVLYFTALVGADLHDD
jgi:hypothetical protein